MKDYKGYLDSLKEDYAKNPEETIEKVKQSLIDSGVLNEDGTIKKDIVTQGY